MRRMPPAHTPQAIRTLWLGLCRSWRTIRSACRYRRRRLLRTFSSSLPWLAEGSAACSRRIRLRENAFVASSGATSSNIQVMGYLLRALRLLAMVVWVGGLIFFAFVEAPTAFHVMG